MHTNHPRMLFAGIAVVAMVTSLLLAAILIALFRTSPVLFGVVFTLTSGVMWFFWLEPFGYSITRDVVSHIREIGD